MTDNNKKTRYYDFGQTVIASLHGERKRLLFHVCCGPCACFPLTYLCPHFDVTIYYCNPNIYPSEEYDRRLGELKKLLDYLKRDYGFEIGLVIPPYDPDAYYEFIKPYEHLPEGSVLLHSFERVKADPDAFIDNFNVEEKEANRLHASTLIEPYGDGYVRVNPPFPPETEEEMDSYYSLPFTKQLLLQPALHQAAPSALQGQGDTGL